MIEIEIHDREGAVAIYKSEHVPRVGDIIDLYGKLRRKRSVRAVEWLVYVATNDKDHVAQVELARVYVE